MLTHSGLGVRQINGSAVELAQRIILIPRQRRAAAERQPATSATRYLSAAAYLDEEFRRRCLREVYHQRRRLVAPSYGFDTVTVLHHCCQARRITLVRDGVLVCVAAFTLVFVPTVFWTAAVLVLLSILAPRGVRWIRDRATRARAKAISELLAFGGRTALAGVLAVVVLIMGVPVLLSAPVAHVRTRLSSLSVESGPGSQLRGLTITDRVFIAASETISPVPSLDRPVVASIIDNPVGPARHFLVCQVVTWSGELVTTLHLHIALQGRCLVVQLSSYGLAPCNPEYRIIDHRENTGPLPYLGAIVRGLLQAPRVAASAPYRLSREVVDRVVARDPAAMFYRREGRAFNYGAHLSIRELGSRDTTRNRFQTLDVYKYSQIMKSRALAAILDFLDTHHVDTSEYRQRSTAILNQGVIFSNNPNMSVDTLNNIQDGNVQPTGGTRE